MLYLIAYDITEARRLQKLQRYLQQSARALQRSVYLLEGNQAEFALCLAGIQQRIHPQHDDVRIYRISTPARLLCKGRSLNPEGVWISGEQTRISG
jgi:CRISPR-associated protein Cas2